MYSGKQSLKIYEIMSKPVVKVREDDSVRNAADKMRKQHVGSVVVFNKSGKATGMITEGDIVRRLALKTGARLDAMKAKQLMSKPLVVIGDGESIQEASRTMVEHKVKRLCVVDENKKLVGIITDNDIMKNAGYMIDVLSEMVSTRYSGR